MKRLYQQPFAGEKLYEYLLIIPINGKLEKRVSAIKLEFSTAYARKIPSNEPHITMINFIQFASMEFRIINCFEKFAQFIKPVAIDLNGFGEFTSHSIYIKVQSAEPLKQLVSEMSVRFRKLLEVSNLLKPNFISKPHLIIAKGLTEIQFETAWPIWRKEHFVDSFIANEMLLIKREIDPETLKPIGPYKKIKHFPFRGKTPERQLVMAL